MPSWGFSVSLLLIALLNCTSILYCLLKTLSYFLYFQRSTFIYQRKIVLTCSALLLFKAIATCTQSYIQILWTWVIAQDLSVLSKHPCTNRHKMEFSFCGSRSGITPQGARLQGAVTSSSVLRWVFRDGIMRCKFIADSWWSEFGLAMKAHGSALCPGDLMAGKSWMATLWLWFSIISSSCCWNWHWRKWWDLGLKFSPNCFFCISIPILFCRYFLKLLMTYQHFTEVLSLSKPLLCGMTGSNVKHDRRKNQQGTS